MKLALDVSAVPDRVAGAGRYIVELASRLPERGVETTLIARRGDETRWHELAAGATIKALVPSRRVERLVYEARLINEGHSPDSQIWHSPHYTMPHRLHRPVVVTVHDLTFFTNPEWHERSKVAFFRRAITYSVKNARVLVSVSAYSARVLEEIFPAHAPVVVAPLGVELDAFRPESAGDHELFRSSGLDRDVPYIFFVGTVEPRKGLDVLLDAFSEVAGDDESIELWLAGQSGWGVGPIDMKISTHPFQGRIRRLGYVDEKLLAALYRNARVVAYPSRGEGFGLPVLEAMACGAPVVTSVGTVMAEVAGDAAQLVAVGDSSGLASALDLAINAGDTDRAMWSRRARARAETFTWSGCVDQHLVAYDMALNS